MKCLRRLEGTTKHQVNGAITVDGEERGEDSPARSPHLIYKITSMKIRAAQPSPQPLDLRPGPGSPCERSPLTHLLKAMVRPGHYWLDPPRGRGLGQLRQWRSHALLVRFDASTGWRSESRQVCHLMCGNARENRLGSLVWHGEAEAVAAES